MRPIRYCITDLRSTDFEPFLDRLAGLAARREIDYLQIRQKDFSPRDLLAFTRLAAAIARPLGVKVLVSERADVALAAGADGVHLPSRALSPLALRRAGVGLIGVSCHDAAELGLAEREGADFAVLSPVFAPLSKAATGAALGLAEFGRLAGAARIPVLALGGVTRENSAACLAAGAAGVAGIGMFDPQRVR